MKKIWRMVGIVTAVVVFLVVLVASVAMAAGPNPNPGTGTCPNPDCTNVCPNPDCPGDGDQHQYQKGPRNSQESVLKYQYRACWD